MRAGKISRDWKVNAAFFPGLGKFRALFSKAWKLRQEWGAFCWPSWLCDQAQL
jgi:hypothetical protein